MTVLAIFRSELASWAMGAIPSPITRAWCRKGHAMTPDNSYVRKDTGAAECRLCRAAASKRYRDRMRAHSN